MTNAQPRAWHYALERLEASLTSDRAHTTGVPTVRLMRLIALMWTVKIPRYQDSLMFGAHRLIDWNIGTGSGSLPGIEWRRINSADATAQRPGSHRMYSKPGPVANKATWRTAGLLCAIGVFGWFFGHRQIEPAAPIAPSSTTTATHPVANAVAMQPSAVVNAPQSTQPTVAMTPATTRSLTRPGRTNVARLDHRKRSHHASHLNARVANRYSKPRNASVFAPRSPDPKQDLPLVEHTPTRHGDWADRLVQRRITDDPVAFLGPQRPE